MIQVIVIGSGNVAQHLIKAFANSDKIAVVQAYARHKSSLNHLLDSKIITDDVNNIKEADLYIIAISDQAIQQFSVDIPFQNKLVVHTSGSLPMNDLDAKNRKGVFYPLQTFSKDKEVDFSKIPLCIEAENSSDCQLLETVGRSVSSHVYMIDSKQRKALHVSAVFVNNFVNHLYQIGFDICKENKVPFEILQPLILETADKILTLPPNEAQTGPAKRQDIQTINSHIHFLSDQNQQEIYKILTKSIIDHGKKL
jgi:predicted short-subunit dehydrogenase-like oxidoreductase (DUF2520 family)